MARYKVKKRWKPGKHKGFMLTQQRRAAIHLGYDPRVRLLTCREAGAVLRHSVEWVRAQIKSGKMRHVTYGREYFITTKEITRWMGMGHRASTPFKRLLPRNPKNETSPAVVQDAGDPPRDGSQKVRQSPGILISSRYQRESPIRVLVARMLGHGDAERD